MAPTSVLVTGASGFIGSRITECLTRGYGLTVHALVRRLGTVGAARLARLSDVRLFYGDVVDRQAVMKAAEGCASIIHCATGVFGNLRAQRDVTVGGTRHILDAAAANQVQRVVYFSSAAVHDLGRATGMITEAAPLRGSFPYAKMKIDAESEVRRACGRGVPAVILRPTCVWGPQSPNWTVGAVEAIRKGLPVLPGDGSGSANAVYIDNLVDAVHLALTSPEAVGQTFLVNDDEPRTWGQLYGGYAACLGVPLVTAAESPGTLEMLRISAHNTGLLLRSALQGQAPRDIRLLRQAYTHVPLAKHVVGALPDVLKQSIKRRMAGRELVAEGSGTSSAAPAAFLPYPFMPAPTRKLYGTTARYANEALKRRLGWAPRVSFEQGLARTCEWLRYAGYAA